MYMVFFRLIMIKGIFETYNLAGTFMLPLSNFTQHGYIAYFAYIVSPHGYHTSGVTSLFEPNFISYVTLLNEDYFAQVYAYKCSKLRYLVKLHIFTLLITFYLTSIYFKYLHYFTLPNVYIKLQVTNVDVYVNKQLSEPQFSYSVKRCPYYLQQRRRLTVKRCQAKQKYDTTQSIVYL